MSTKITTPIPFKRKFFLIDNDIVSKGFVIISDEVLPQSIDLKIEDRSYVIYDYQYQVVKITTSNKNAYPGSNIDDYVIHWRNNFTFDCESVPVIIDFDDLGKVLEIRYVSHDEDIEISELSPSTKDEIGWEVLLQKFIITITSEGDGVVTPSGELIINQHESIDLIFSPDMNNMVYAVIIDGINHGNISSYYIDDISKNYTVHVIFRVQQYYVEIL